MAPTSSCATFDDGKKDIGSISSETVTAHSAVDLQSKQARLVNREILFAKFFSRDHVNRHGPGFKSRKSLSNFLYSYTASIVSRIMR